ncbi:DUF7507 domain-containing protein, partial [Mesorhizobium japonicum]|uniref:DUF7507 domain-containing protein n=1 Tax=Mesorhizobium japonicum TaxID=2066070 RepID=UPI003B59F674
APGSNLVDFKTVGTRALASGNGRFLKVSADFAALNCSTSDPSLGPSYGLTLFDAQGNRTSVGTGFDPCSGTAVQSPTAYVKYVDFGDGGPDYIPIDPATVHVATFESDTLLFTAPRVGLEIRNANGSKIGNDGAMDNIRILDVTPSVALTADQLQAEAGQSVRLTYTVTNTSELGSKYGWSFSTPLPSGLVLSSTPDFSSDCDVLSSSADPGADHIDMVGHLGAGVASCSVAVSVTSPTAADYVVDWSNGAQYLGLDPSGATTLTFTAPPNPSISLTKQADAPVDVDGDGLTDVGDTIGYSFTVLNDGNTPLSSVAVSDSLLTGGVSCVATSLAPGDSTTCHSNVPYHVSAADLAAGKVHNSATASATDDNTG